MTVYYVGELCISHLVHTLIVVKEEVVMPLTPNHSRLDFR